MATLSSSVLRSPPRHVHRPGKRFEARVKRWVRNIRRRVRRRIQMAQA